MTRTVVDTSALVALRYPDDAHDRAAAAILHDAAERGALLVNPVVYADPFVDTPEALDAFLEDTGIAVEAIPRSAGFAAGAAFGRYLERRGDGLQCGECGRRTTYTRPECGAGITARQHIAAEFLIGAHAEANDALVTVDAGSYRDYFDVHVLSIRSA